MSLTPSLSRQSKKKGAIISWCVEEKKIFLTLMIVYEDLVSGKGSIS